MRHLLVEYQIGYPTILIVLLDIPAFTLLLSLVVIYIQNVQSRTTFYGNLM
jgi:hypothetical protein